MNASHAPNRGQHAASARLVVRRGALRARRTAWGRVLSILLLLAFGRAVVVPPCEAHGSMDHGGPTHASAAHASATETSAAHSGTHAAAAPSGQDEHDAPHGDRCVCIGACHHAAAAAWIASEPPRIETPVQEFLETPTPVARPAVSRAHHPYVLPFATAPPTLGA